MSQLLIAGLLASFIPLSTAFTVDFNAKDHCLGSALGTFTGSVGTGCQTRINNATDSTDLINVPGGSFNVIAHPQKGKDDKTAVAFYSNPDCTLLIGFSNVPSCVGAGAYRSYEVIQLSDAWAGEYNLQPPEIVSQSPNATVTRTSGELLPTAYGNSSSTSSHSASTSHSKTSTSHTSASHSTTSHSTISHTTASHSTTSTHAAAKRSTLERRANVLARDPDPLQIDHYASGPAPAHGAVRRTPLGVSKFQQIAARAWQGIPAGEWSDDLHIRDTSPLPTSAVPASLLNLRSTPPQTCNLIRTCMINAAPGSELGLRAAGPALLDAIKSLNPKGDYWTFLQRALVVEIVEGGKTAGYVYAQTQLP